MFQADIVAFRFINTCIIQRHNISSHSINNLSVSSIQSDEKKRCIRGGDQQMKIAPHTAFVKNIKEVRKIVKHT